MNIKELIGGLVVVAAAVLAACLLYAVFAPQHAGCAIDPPFYLQGTAYDCATAGR